MKNLVLNQITLQNFKGIKTLEVNFNSNITNIYGNNGSGKTTLVDAFLWLLFDKDSTNRKDFQIKPLDADNNVIHNLETVVTAVISFDGKVKTFSKIYKETWTKRRNEAEKTLTGHTTTYSIDDVPYKKSEYQAFINDLIDEKIFKIITNPFYFSTQLKWEERRNILIDFAGDVSVEASQYLTDLLEDKTEKQLKDSLNFKKKKLNDALKLIPARIDEVNSSIVEIDTSKLKEKAAYEARLKEINDSLFSFADPFSKEKEALALKRRELNQIEADALEAKKKAVTFVEETLRKQTRELSNQRYSLTEANDKINRLTKTNDSLDIKMQSLRDKFQEVDARKFVFDESLAVCPTCKQSLPEDEVESNKNTLEANFNTEKAETLRTINSRGKELKAEKEANISKIDKLKKEIATINEKINELIENVAVSEKELERVKNEVTVLPETYYTIKDEINSIEETLNTSDQAEQQESLRAEKNSVSDAIQEIRDIEKDIEENEKRKKRIAELEAEETDTASQIAEIEKGLFELEKYTKAKAEKLEENINSKFSFVKFKLFETQINGGIVETCEALINGVPFPDANNAAKYNAGLDIINTLSAHYGVTAPIFFDNRESVNELIDTDSQLINLIVSNDKQLRISTNKKEVA